LVKKDTEKKPVKKKVGFGGKLLVKNQYQITKVTFFKKSILEEWPLCFDPRGGSVAAMTGFFSFLFHFEEPEQC
jgi:hypothetical protein